MRSEVGRITKSNISLIEYDNGSSESNFFIQSGVVGLYASQAELLSIYTILNYYFNLENFAECKLKIGEENVAI